MNSEEKVITVVGISGSLRRDSFNRKVLQTAKRIAAEFGAVVEEIDLKELNVPIYDGDVESVGFPDSVHTLRSKVASADVLMIATPEYNHSISGALKNAIDWLSTTSNVLNGKTAVIFGVSTGLFGTIRAQSHLRQILTALNVTMVPQPQVFIRSANETVRPDGSLNDPKIHAQLKKLIEKSLSLAKLYKPNNNQQFKVI